MRTLLRLTATALLVTLLLPGCGEQTTEQATGQPGDPIDLPATPAQIAKLDAVIERFPEVKPLAAQARSDGRVTEQEIIEVFTAAEQAKAARGGE